MSSSVESISVCHTLEGMCIIICGGSKEHLAGIYMQATIMSRTQLLASRTWQPRSGTLKSLVRYLRPATRQIQNCVPLIHLDICWMMDNKHLLMAFKVNANVARHAMCQNMTFAQHIYMHNTFTGMLVDSDIENLWCSSGSATQHWRQWPDPNGCGYMGAEYTMNDNNQWPHSLIV